ncbi:MAG TPA: ATPase [Syntrophobacteraceae bacterium]|jgi:P-type Ca2+ transporter type 2C|nr:ATPase [Syntrophobacteraceae bacterium]
MKVSVAKDNTDNPQDSDIPYYALTVEATLQQLGTSRAGLSHEEAAQRLVQFGTNVISKEQGEPLWKKFAANLSNIFAVMLWTASALSFLIGSHETGVAIVAVIIINAVFSFVQEYRAEQAIASLRKLLPVEARVRRDGELTKIAAADLVPGDILFLEEGDNTSADGRLISEFDMRMNNATLTGESEPTRKTAEHLANDGHTWTQMPNLVFAGTSVASGSGEAVVFATGMRTAFGRIAHMTQSVRQEKSPLQVQIGRVSRTVTQLAIVLGIFFFILGSVIADLSFRDGAIFAIGIVLANVPEGLLPTLSLALASGAQRLVRRNALVKRLSSVETLGSATVICTDKTGTLTQNEMTVSEAFVAGCQVHFGGVGYKPTGEVTRKGHPVAAGSMPDLKWLLRSASFCNNARILPPVAEKPQWSIIGDPTEGALLVAATKAGFDYQQELASFLPMHQLPFDSRRKRMSLIHRVSKAGWDLAPGAQVVFTKGAPKEVLSACTSILMEGRDEPLAEGEREAIIRQNDQYARAGLRVLAMAYRKLPEEWADYSLEGVERDLTFIGLMAMQDPPRPEVTRAIGRAQSAGIRVVMITGDYGLTGVSIARKIGILRTGVPVVIVTGADLDKMDDLALKNLVSEPADVIFARAAPEHKLRIVEAFRSLGEIVAVTGDGVNDAPALKRAHIGIAMGQSGTDVAKDASTMILTDDNFASIVSAVEEGRAVYDNIRKFVTYIFAHLAGEAVPYVFFALFNLPLPLTPLQILAIDLGTETLPALALGTEKPEPDAMELPPKSPKENLLDRPTLLRGYFYLGLLSSVGVMFGYFWQLSRRGWHWGITGSNPLFATGSLYQREAATMVFLGIVIMQVANVFACRTQRASVFSIGFFSNRLVFAGILFELAFAAALIYVPFLQDLFGTAPIGWENWLILAVFIPFIFFAEEGRKALVRRSRRNARGRHERQSGASGKRRSSK